MAVIGILARINSTRFETLWEELEQQEGITPFPIEDETGRIGILIEKTPASEAYLILDSLQKSSDILGLWPVYEHLEEDSIPLDDNSPLIHNANARNKTLNEEMTS